MSGFARRETWIRGGLLAALAISFLLIVHVYAFPLLPSDYAVTDPKEIQPLPGGPPTAFFFPFAKSAPDRPYHHWSRIELFDDGARFTGNHSTVANVQAGLRNLWAHDGDRVVFATADGSDPRANGRSYDVEYSPLHRPEIGWAALLVFLAAASGLVRRGMSSVFVANDTPRSPSFRHWRLHLISAATIFLVGLYFSTGTLSPYAVTSNAVVEPGSGYLYNTDHQHFRALFDFVDGRDRATWDGAIYLRRILYNVLAWPFMKALGFKVGGAIASLTFNVIAFVGFIVGVRRLIGERAAVFSAWCLAFYPGAAYWGGLPYLHALIVPGCLLAMLVLVWLADEPSWRRIIVGSLLLGVASLAYDFIVYFLPASLLILVWRRRWFGAVVAALVQVTPLVLWSLTLRTVFHQNLVNNNSNAFPVIAQAYLNHPAWATWKPLLSALPDLTVDVFFGSNFFFLPMLAVLVAVVNPLTSRIRPHLAEVALLLAGLSLFVFSNAAPEYTGSWQMRGTYFERIYQPIFPALLLFCARWYQHLPTLRLAPRVAFWLVGSALTFGNALIVFGPILSNPLGMSGVAFYRFYDHAGTDVYEINLHNAGRRPLGFPRAVQQ